MGEFQSRTFTPVEIRSRITPREERIGITVASGQTIAIGTIMAKKTSDGLYYPYNNGHVDGTEKACGILAHSVNTGTTTDVRGLVGQNRAVSVPMYIHGDFVTARLTGLDAAAIADMQMREIGDEVTF